VQNKRSVTIAYIDFTRAFGSVSHDKLFDRLYSYGIRGDVLKWLTNFFSDRTHQTRVGHYLSAVAKLLSGVVQGSGIGPVMFHIYIDELAKFLKSCGIVAKLFADDVKVYVEIINTADAHKLHTALDLIAEWAVMWKLSVSVNKCNILHHIILFGLVDIDFSHFFEFSRTTNTRGHDYKLYKSRCTSNVRSRFFAERVINIWNSLPETINYASLTSFTHTIEVIDFSESLKCT